MFHRETNTLNLWGNRQNTRFLRRYERINASNIKDFRGQTQVLDQDGMLYRSLFYLKDNNGARDVAALTFASFMAMIPFMAMMFVIAVVSAMPLSARILALYLRLGSLLWRSASLTSFTIISRTPQSNFTSSVRAHRDVSLPIVSCEEDRAYLH